MGTPINFRRRARLQDQSFLSQDTFLSPITFYAMYIHCLFIQRKQSYPGEYMPELVLAVDEYVLEENPNYFTEECGRQLQTIGDDCDLSRTAVIRIPDVAVENLFKADIIKAVVVGQD